MYLQAFNKFLTSWIDFNELQNILLVKKMWKWYIGQMPGLCDEMRNQHGKTQPQN